MKDLKLKLFLEKYKELVELSDSMTKEEINILLCSVEYLELHNKYPEYIPL